MAGSDEQRVCPMHGRKVANLAVPCDGRKALGGGAGRERAATAAADSRRPRETGLTAQPWSVPLLGVGGQHRQLHPGQVFQFLGQGQGAGGGGAGAAQAVAFHPHRVAGGD